jgi:predicted metalloprotease
MRGFGVLVLCVCLLATARAVAASVVGGPQQGLSRLSPGAPADPNKPPPTRPCPDPPCFEPSAGRTPAAFLNWVGDDVGSYWRKRLGAASLRWHAGREVVVRHGKTARSACGGEITASMGPFYCAKDTPPALFLPVDGLRGLVLRTPNWRHWKKKDFAFAYVVAHEWGHHLQNVLGILHKSHLKSIQIELQADCLAGVWSYSTWARDLLEPGDIPKAVRLARLAGDTPGTPKNDPTAHGTAAQRAGWFKRGYESGTAAKCVVPAP